MTRKLNFRERYFPYVLRRVGDSCFWMPLNREYQPLGRDESVEGKTRLSIMEYLLSDGVCLRLTKRQIVKLQNMGCKLQSDTAGAESLYLISEKYPEILIYLYGVKSSTSYDHQEAYAKVVLNMRLNPEVLQPGQMARW